MSGLWRFHCIPQVLGRERESVVWQFFLSSAHTSPAHLSVIGGDFVLESVIRCAAFVRYSEFGGCPLFGSRKCTASTGIAVGTSTVVRYSEEVRYWEGPLSEVPLYIYTIIILLNNYNNICIYISIQKATNNDAKIGFPKTLKVPLYYLLEIDIV